MFPLPVELRKLLENSIPTARVYAENAAGVILTTLAVDRTEPYASLTQQQRRLRNALRARARQLGNGVMADGLQLLKEEIAYEQWHRMVFACFLAENNLLMHPSGVPVTLKDCEDLAADEGELDGWAVAAKYASLMLPGIFRPDDPSVQVRMTPEGLRTLENILKSFPSSVYTAGDSLGWMYQFWQSNKKKEVNDSERKIGGADISPVTQLFTEDYMVRFLLENTLGAWWAGKHPTSPLLKRWKYLRFKDDGTPAAGTFPGWPLIVAAITIMDPCCGSGHFLVVAFEMLCLMRMEEEGLDQAAAAEAVLRDNIFGLELDPRCTQIAAFALGLSAWKSGGYRPIPVPNVACSGIPVQGQLDSWLKLAGKDARLRAALERLYNLFSDAPHLGSLINPEDLPAADRMFVADYEQVAPILDKAMAIKDGNDDPVAEIFGAAAEGVAKAARLLANKFTLVTTNVPFLGRNKQESVIVEFCDANYPLSKMDLSSVFLERCIAFTSDNCTFATITPQNWLFLGRYKQFRKKILTTQTWNFLVRLGTGAFETISGEVVNVQMIIGTNKIPSDPSYFSGIDVSKHKVFSEKINHIASDEIQTADQLKQLANPTHTVSLTDLQQHPPLSQYVTALSGLSTGEMNRFLREFWEVSNLRDSWEFIQSGVAETTLYGGKSSIILWEKEKGDLYKLAESVRHLNHAAQNWRRGKPSWGKRGVTISTMNNISATLYLGEIYDESCCALVPFDQTHVSALWAFCSSSEFVNELRKLNPNLNVKPGYFLQVPFDLEHWQEVADAAGALPEPHSDDPTQWLFKGHPKNSTEPLQVAVARLLGYRWPEQPHDDLDALADEDGIVSISPLVHETPAVDRLRELLTTAYDKEWSARQEAQLISQAGSEGKSLDTWLRDDFFAQHCRLFHNRPFIWHIWDGRKDGFSVLVNYHKLDSTRLDKLIFTYLGDWIRLQRAHRDHGEPGADGRLVAALELEKKLKLIKEGEPPYDIYVRWKSLKEQPIGWNPDLNDGVRLNIRPFVTAGILRSKFTINWNKDRGKNPDGSDRENDLHYTLVEKRSAQGG
jgi:hypothetical protein